MNKTMLDLPLAKEVKPNDRLAITQENEEWMSLQCTVQQLMTQIQPQTITQQPQTITPQTIAQITNNVVKNVIVEVVEILSEKKTKLLYPMMPFSPYDAFEIVAKNNTKKAQNFAYPHHNKLFYGNLEKYKVF